MAEYGIETVPDGMSDDAGNGDKVGHTVAESIALAMARGNELVSDTYGAGSVVGDLMPIHEVLPELDAGVGSLTTGTFDQKPGGEA